MLSKYFSRAIWGKPSGPSPCDPALLRAQKRPSWLLGQGRLAKGHSKQDQRRHRHHLLLLYSFRREQLSQVGLTMGLHSWFYASHQYSGNKLFKSQKLFVVSGSQSWTPWSLYFSCPVWSPWLPSDPFTKILLATTQLKIAKRPRKNLAGNWSTVSFLWIYSGI